MKTTPLLTSCAVLAAMAISASASPLLQYEFNTPGAVQNSSGSENLSLTIRDYSGAEADFIRSNPQDRSGQAGGYVLDFTSGTVDAAAPGNQAAKGALQSGTLSASTTPYLTSGLSSFTISAWVYNANATYDSANRDRRIFSLRNGSGGVIDFRLNRLGLNNPNALIVSLTNSEGAQQFTAGSGVTVPGGNQEWYFVALTYDAETGLGTFYAGADGGTLTMDTFHFLDSNEEAGQLLTNATSLAIGNAGYNHARRFDGALSDVRFYGTALDTAGIQAIYAIPEPGSVSLLLGSGMAALLLNWKRGRSLSK